MPPKKTKRAVDLETIGTRNFYEILPKALHSDADKITYPNEKLINVSLPSGIAVIGSTGSFKTNWLLNLIEVVGTFDRVTLYAKKLDEKLYIYLLNCLEQAGIPHEAFDTLEKVIPCNEYDAKQNNLVIIDDFMNAPKKALEPIVDLFTMGRKNSITPIYLAQTYFSGVPKTIRDNVNYLVVFKLKSKSDINRIMADVSLDYSKDEMVELLKHIRSKGDRYFMLIDKITNNPSLKVRMNFKGL